jgi:hypothetical protein
VTVPGALIRTRPLVVVTGVLVGAHLLALALRGSSGREGARALRWFDLGLENNVPTAWSVLLMLRIAVLAALLAWAARVGRAGWWAAAAVAAAMAADEWVGWHEHLRTPGAWLADQGLDLPTYAWLVPGALIALVGTLLAIAWSRRLPPHGRRLLVGALAVYAAGALGFEAISGWADEHGASWRSWSALTAVEETLEMAGALIAASAVATAVTAHHDEDMP